jgi:hypothetical protein
MRLVWESRQEQDFATWFELNITAEAVFRVLESKHALILQENPFRTCVQTLTIGISTPRLHRWSPMGGDWRGEERRKR